MNKLTEGIKVYYSGYPAEGIPGSGSYRLYPQSLIGFVPKSEVVDGYELILTGEPIPGLSGGPIFNENAQLVGIYGRGHIIKKRSNTEGETLSRSLYGISINTAINLSAHLNLDIGPPISTKKYFDLRDKNIDYSPILTPYYKGEDSYINVASEQLFNQSSVDKYDNKLVSFKVEYVGLEESTLTTALYDISAEGKVFLGLYSSTTMIVYIDKKYADKIFQYPWGILNIEGSAKKVLAKSIAHFSGFRDVLQVEVHRIKLLEINPYSPKNH